MAYETISVIKSSQSLAARDAELQPQSVFVAVGNSNDSGPLPHVIARRSSAASLISGGSINNSIGCMTVNNSNILNNSLQSGGHQVAGPGHHLAGPGQQVAGPGHQVAGPGHQVAGPGQQVAGPGHQVVGPGHQVAGPGHQVAGPGLQVVRPENCDNGPVFSLNGQQGVIVGQQAGGGVGNQQGGSGVGIQQHGVVVNGDQGLVVGQLTSNPKGEILLADLGLNTSEQVSYQVRF